MNIFQQGIIIWNWNRRIQSNNEDNNANYREAVFRLEIYILI